jgi:hypothetical protein
MLRFRFKRADDATPRPDEPRTVPEAQRWLSHNGFRECTEDNARRLLFVRRLVREGRLTDDGR